MAQHAEATQVRSGKNRLQHEKSPYLLQHADNPVDWYAWGEEAFAAARRENKPIFLSIGYSTCHWCHVMERESFEDPEVAVLMNDVFINIKVDREERPDIDNIYMSVCQMMTRGGGWPLTIIMTPNKKPFFAGTYFPKTGRYGRMGMVDLVPRIKQMWETEREKVNRSAEQITSALAQSTITTPGAELNEATIESAYEQLAGRFDIAYGGFGTGRKFPTPHNLLFLLRQYNSTGDLQALQMVEKTLQAMRKGGIYDHVGFGFHRYATDREWLVPHFEKMLYDQALLTLAYTEAYQVTGKEEYANTVHEILTYVLRDMTSPAGGFYSAEDADSEGEEGKFYLWTQEEIKDILGRDAGFFIETFNIERDGNYVEETTRQKTGANIAFLQRPLIEIAARQNISEDKLHRRLEKTRRKLFAKREQRVHPYKDDKILTDWNGLIIAALAKAAQVFGRSEYAQAAGRAADYAFMAWGLLELYEATFEARYLRQALALNDELLDRFWDDNTGGFYFTDDDAEDLIVRQKEIYDGAVPSGNSVTMMNLLRLGRITGRPEFEEKANRIGRAFYNEVSRTPSAHTMLMMAVSFAVGPTYEVVIVGQAGSADTKEMLRTLQRQFLPNKIVLFRPNDDPAPDIVKLAEFTKYHTSIGGKATAYVCRNYACALPTTDINEMLKMLSNSGSS